MAKRERKTPVSKTKKTSSEAPKKEEIAEEKKGAGLSKKESKWDSFWERYNMAKPTKSE